MIRTAIIAAMSGELKPLVQKSVGDWRHERRHGVDLWRWAFDTGEWVAACAGAGQNAATRALAEVEKDGPVASVLSVGWAGALGDSYVPGQAYRVAGVVDTLTGERFRVARVSAAPSMKTIPLGLKPGKSSSASVGTAEAVPFQSSPSVEAVPLQGSDSTQAAPAQHDVWLATSPRVADAAEKQRLAASYCAGLVDMEAAAIARLAAMRGISFHCIKGVSDGFGDQLPDFNRFLTREGQFQTARFTVFALFHPGYWRALKQMGENSRKASQSIAESVLAVLDPQGTVRNRNGYPDHRR
jgi:adenosylhomocysteine nucleosidase